MQVEEEPSEKTKKVERDAKKVRRMYNLTQSNEASTQRSVLARIITLADASVWCPSVCLSVCPIFLTFIGSTPSRRIFSVTHRGANATRPIYISIVVIFGLINVHLCVGTTF